MTYDGPEREPWWAVGKCFLVVGWSKYRNRIETLAAFTSLEHDRALSCARRFREGMLSHDRKSIAIVEGRTA